MRARRVVLPGEFIAEQRGKRLGKGVYAERNRVYAKVIGIPKVDATEVSVIPLAGVYVPKVGDCVIGVVTDVVNGWWLDLNCPWPAFLPLNLALEGFMDVSKTDLSQYYAVGDVLYCKVVKVTSTMDVQVSMRELECKKLQGGILIGVSPAKIPRLVGKGGSMISMLKQKTKCKILVGENGMVWVKGAGAERVLQAVRTIEREALFYGLTTKIEHMLEHGTFD